MIYIAIAISFFLVFVAFSTFFMAYKKEVEKAEIHVGFRIPRLLSGMLKATLALSFAYVCLSSLYLMYATLISTQIIN